MLYWKPLFASLSVIAGILASLIYAKSVVINKSTKPHPITWLTWAITQSMVALIIFEKGGRLGALSLAGSAIFAFFTFIFSLKTSIGKIRNLDIIILLIILISIFMWLFVNNSIISLFLITSVDAVGYLPTFIKSIKNPWEEDTLAWFIYFLGNVFTILALFRYSLFTMLYLVTIAVMNISVAIFCIYRRNMLNNLNKKT